LSPALYKRWDREFVAETASVLKVANLHFCKKHQGRNIKAQLEMLFLKVVYNEKEGGHEGYKHYVIALQLEDLNSFVFYIIIPPSWIELIFVSAQYNKSNGGLINK